MVLISNHKYEVIAVLQKFLLTNTELIESVGRSAALLAQQIHYLSRNPKNDNFFEGKPWVHFTLSHLGRMTRYTRRTTIRSVNRLREEGLLIVKNFDDTKWKTANYYCINYDKLKEICPQSYKKYICGKSEQKTVDEELKRCQNVTKSNNKSFNDQPRSIIKLSVGIVNKNVNHQGRGWMEYKKTDVSLCTLSDEFVQVGEEKGFSRRELIWVFEKFKSRYIREAKESYDWLSVWKTWLKFEGSPQFKGYHKSHKFPLVEEDLNEVLSKWDPPALAWCKRTPTVPLDKKEEEKRLGKTRVDAPLEINIAHFFPEEEKTPRRTPVYRQAKFVDNFSPGVRDDSLDEFKSLTPMDNVIASIERKIMANTRDPELEKLLAGAPASTYAPLEKIQIQPKPLPMEPMARANVLPMQDEWETFLDMIEKRGLTSFVNAWLRKGKVYFLSHTAEEVRMLCSCNFFYSRIFDAADKIYVIKQILCKMFPGKESLLVSLPGGRTERTYLKDDRWK